MAEWFAPKRYGYGAGLPIAWQGWALLGVYLTLVVGAAFLLGEDEPLAVLAVIAPATVCLIVISASTTRGGWRWRWGEGDDGGDSARRRGRGTQSTRRSRRKPR